MIVEIHHESQEGVHGFLIHLHPFWCCWRKGKRDEDDPLKKGEKGITW
jgi:hypothetical protein